MKKFIDDNKKIPNKKSKNEYEKKIGEWLSHQITNYTNEKNCMNYNNEDKEKSAENKIRYNKWTEFLKENKKYFKTDDETWNENFENLKKFINDNKKIPNINSENDDEITLGQWRYTNNSNYNNKRDGMKDKVRYDLWTEFIKENKKYFKNNDIIWDEHFKNLKNFISKYNKLPHYDSKGYEKTLYNWISTQKANHYKIRGCMNYNHENEKEGMKNKVRYDLWTEFLKENETYFGNLTDDDNILQSTTNLTSENTQSISIITDEAKEEIIITPKKKRSTNLQRQGIKKKEKPESKEEIQKRTQCELTQLHKTYLKMNSENLYNKFKENPELFKKYHEIREEYMSTYNDDEIPIKFIIKELEKINTKKTKTIVDAGCGLAHISKHFTSKNDKRFNFINYDHQASDETIISCNISKMLLDDCEADYVILSMCLSWGSDEDKEKYLKESWRVLETQGNLLIIDSTKKWSETNDDNYIEPGMEGIKLKKMLEQNGFKIIKEEIKKFCYFNCIKI